jgi:O-antigen/teichoic acid export membrane protein
MEPNLSSSRVVVRNAVFNIAGYSFSVAYVFFLIPIVVHHVGVEQFGLWSLMIALTGYVGLADFGLSTSFVKYIAEYVSLKDYEKVNTVVQHGLLYYGVLSLLFLAIGWLLYVPVFDLLKIPPERYEVATVTFFLALAGFGITSMTSVFVSVLVGLQRTDVFNTMAGIVMVVRFAAIMIALQLGKGLPGLMVADVLVTFVSAIPLWMVTRRRIPQLRLRFVRYDHQMMKRLLSFGSQLQISRVAELVQAQFDKFLLTRFVGLTAVSLYDFGSRPLVRLRALPLSAISSLVPAVSALDAEHNPARILAGLLRATRYLMIVALPLFAFFVCFAHEIITVWLGSGFDQAATTMQLLSIPYFFSVVVSVLSLVSQGMGEPKFQMQAMLVQAGLNILLSTVLVTVLGYFGAVLGTIIAGVVGSLLFVHLYGRRLMTAPARTFAGMMGKPLLSVAVAAAIGYASLLWLQSMMHAVSRGGAFISLTLAGIVFLLAYMIVLLLTRTFGPDDKGFLMNVLPRRFQKFIDSW